MTWNADEQKGIKNAEIEARLIRSLSLILTAVNDVVEVDNLMTQLVCDDWIIKRFNLWLFNPCPSKLRKESLLFFK